MYRFNHAIVRKPSRSLARGLTEANLGRPDYALALKQHALYVAALEGCGLQVEVLEALESCPDSVFVEDVAVLTPRCAVLTRPGAAPRSAEVVGMRSVVESLFSKVERIVTPGTLDGGDVMQIGNHCYIGLSGRTNQAGAQQLMTILDKHGLSGSVVPVQSVLHLKTGVTSFAPGCLLAIKEFTRLDLFSDFEVLEVAPEEPAAANILRINDRLLMSAGCPQTEKKLRERGEDVVTLDISEYAKLDGGLTCLSLRY